MRPTTNIWFDLQICIQISICMHGLLRSIHGLVFLLFKSLKGFGVIGPWFAMGRSLFVKLLGRASFFSLVCFPFD